MFIYERLDTTINVIGFNNINNNNVKQILLRDSVPQRRYSRSSNVNLLVKMIIRLRLLLSRRKTHLKFNEANHIC